jgi:hypothetical protein
MKPKQKAEYLIDQIEHDTHSVVKGYEAKLCALITVDEMINEYEKYTDVNSRLNPVFTDDLVSVIEMTEYWKDVKNELLKLLAMNEQVKSKLHLFLPYKLKTAYLDGKNTAFRSELKPYLYECIINGQYDNNDKLKFYFRQLSDLTNPVLSNGEIPIEVLNINPETKRLLSQIASGKPYYNGMDDAPYKYTDQYIPFNITEQLISWNFWLWDQSLFESGEILNLNDIEK